MQWWRVRVVMAVPCAPGHALPAVVVWIGFVLCLLKCFGG